MRASLWLARKKKFWASKKLVTGPNGIMVAQTPLFFTLKTSKYCDKGKKDQHKNQESNIQQYTHSKPNKQNRVHVLCKVVLIECYKLSKNFRSVLTTL
jgi:hypothetical protein